MSATVPKTAKGLTLQKAEKSLKPEYINDAVLVEYPIPELKPDEVLVKVTAAAFNYKDVRDA